LSGDFLITDVRFKKTWQGGEYTEVSCTLPDAFTADENAEGSAAAGQRTGSYGAGTPDVGAYGPVNPADAGINSD
jgi:hypothetical protein